MQWERPGLQASLGVWPTCSVTWCSHFPSLNPRASRFLCGSGSPSLTHPPPAVPCLSADSGPGGSVVGEGSWEFRAEAPPQCTPPPQLVLGQAHLAGLRYKGTLSTVPAGVTPFPQPPLGPSGQAVSHCERTSFRHLQTRGVGEEGPKETGGLPGPAPPKLSPSRV